MSEDSEDVCDRYLEAYVSMLLGWVLMMIQLLAMVDAPFQQISCIEGMPAVCALLYVPCCGTLLASNHVGSCQVTRQAILHCY
jgi:hypothetical protein